MAIDTSQQRQAIFSRLGQSTLTSSQDDQSWLRPRKLSQHSTDELYEHFCKVLGAHNTFIHPISDLSSLPFSVSDYIQQHGFPNKLYLGDNPELLKLDWQQHAIACSLDSFTEDGQAAISTAEFGIADTGTVVLSSSARNPTRNNFLAEHHLVVLKKQSILPYSEDVWEAIQNKNSRLPRAINFISGPSSSADVGLKLEYGAHGPRTLAIFIIQ